MQKKNQEINITSKKGGISSTIRAFTLIEMSIVIVIIGLIVAGILAGQSMIRAAAIRTVISDSQTFSTAMASFFEKYQSLPGDMSDATEYWGAANTGGSGGNCANSLTDIGSDKKATCNGNDNGEVDPWAETWRAWQHLSNAKMLAGTYTGTQGSLGMRYTEPGVNSPDSPIDAAGYAISHRTIAPHSAPKEGNPILFGAEEGVDNIVITTPEAWSIDVKMDDGLPLQGDVWTYPNVNRPQCTSTNDPFTAVYLAENDVIACNLFFGTAF